MDINNFTKLRDDPGAVKYNTDNTNKISNYIMATFKDELTLKNTKHVSLEQQKTLYNDSYGRVSNESADYESRAVNTNKLTNLNTINTLNPRAHLTSPFLLRGNSDKTIENKLKFVESTRHDVGRGCSVNSIDRFVPQLAHIKAVQDPNHIIPENSDHTWKRGGQSSRLIMRDADYENRCGTTRRE
tara:strand:+ start:278 stop:835 length:558 start_codon:yes stop_codon:yes gene_type:complete